MFNLVVRLRRNVCHLLVRRTKVATFQTRPNQSVHHFRHKLGVRFRDATATRKGNLFVPGISSHLESLYKLDVLVVSFRAANQIQQLVGIPSKRP